MVCQEKQNNGVDLISDCHNVLSDATKAAIIVNGA